jgi:hypothetical protein
MTAAELKTEFLVGYDKVANFAAPGFINSEISQFLSEAQEMFVKQHYHPMGNKYQEGFEETEKRRKDLAAIGRQSQCVISADQTDVISTNSIIFDLPSNHWLTTVEWVQTSDNCGKQKKVVPVTQDTYFGNNENPFKKPSSNKLWRLEATPLNGQARHEVITNGEYTITNYNLRYIKQLTDIDIDGGVTSELNSMTHREIVNIAVTTALENQQEPRSQTHAQLGERAE